MRKTAFGAIILLIVVNIQIFTEENYLKIRPTVSPKQITHGNEGLLKIKITPLNGIKISSHPELLIQLNENNNLIFSKKRFKASEFDWQPKQENGSIFLDLEKEIEIPFKVKENSQVTGKLVIHGEIIFTAVDKKSWSLKTYQKFSADFTIRRNYKAKKK